MCVIVEESIMKSYNILQNTELGEFVLDMTYDNALGSPSWIQFTGLL